MMTRNSTLCTCDKQNNELVKRTMFTIALIMGLLLAATPWSTNHMSNNPWLQQPSPPMERVLNTKQVASLFGDDSSKPEQKTWHPPHVVKVWMARHKNRVFRVVQLPRCEHLETVITYNPSGETLKQAKIRVGGVAAVTGSYHHPRSMALADFLQRDGCVLAGARTGRCLVVINRDGLLDISPEYNGVKGQPGVSALALGQRLVPLEKDGFSTAFMNRVTDRMAIGVNRHFIFIVQGKSDIWRLAHFIRTKLPVRSAVNSDGGHVVKGKAPVHIVFRWRTNTSTQRPVHIGPTTLGGK